MGDHWGPGQVGRAAERWGGREGQGIQGDVVSVAKYSLRESAGSRYIARIDTERDETVLVC